MKNLIFKTAIPFLILYFSLTGVTFFAASLDVLYSIHVQNASEYFHIVVNTSNVVLLAIISLLSFVLMFFMLKKVVAEVN